MTITADEPLGDDARELRLRAFQLIEANYPELRQQIIRWLGTAHLEDDTRVDEVVLILLVRAGDGGAFVPLLPPIPPGDPSEKRLLFTHTHFVTREVVKSAKRQRRRPPAPSDRPDDKQQPGDA